MSKPSRDVYLAALEIVPWVEREGRGGVPPAEAGDALPIASPLPAIPGEPSGPATADLVSSGDRPADAELDDAELDWEPLAERVSGCPRCALCQSRTQTVFGTGNRQAQLMVVGEAPGAEEDRRGEPFVGRAGKLLDQMLAAIGSSRQQVYIANILKCRPPNNRDPAAEEVLACQPYLQRQIALVQPRVLLAVGRIAAQNLLQVTTPLGRMRGSVQQYVHPDGRVIPVVVTYHPAYLLRSPLQKRAAWDDLKQVMHMIEPPANPE